MYRKMSNLLPTEAKKTIKKESHLRVAVVALFLLAALLLVSVVWLVPAYILSANKYNVTEGELVALKNEIEQLQPDDPKEEIDDINEKLGVLKGGPFTEHYAYDLITDIIEKKNEDIQITNIFYDKTNTEIKVLLRGNALNRESLSSFVSEIEKNKLYSRVDLPISNFVKETNLEFSLNVYIEYKEPEAQ